MSKSQVSMEFIMITGLVFLVFSGFLVLMYNQFSELNEKKSYSAMYSLANLIKKEVLMASKVHDNYIRKFEMPYRVSGLDYKINLEKDVLIITNENNISVTVILPIEVKGSFIEKTEKGQMKHCITKNKFDGVRIARNQASIELEENYPIMYDRDENGILDISAGEEFYAYVRMNCLDNIQTIGFSLELTNLDYIGYGLIYQYELGVLQDQFKNPFFYEEPDEINVLEQWNPVTKRLTFSIPQKPGQASSGSGNIVKLRLQALSGTAKIEFVEDKIFLIDNTATYLTEESLPSSNLGATIEII